MVINPIAPGTKMPKEIQKALYNIMLPIAKRIIEDRKKAANEAKS
ncbi:MAG: hypothetical protein K0S74_1859 [Chlamydiales bacterium]|nr:hypothetical protein [Chlamydiales bacterium]